MRRKKGWSIFGWLFAIAVVLFLGLGLIRMKTPETAEKLPDALQDVAEVSQELWEYMRYAVRPAEEEPPAEERPWNLTLVNPWNPVPSGWEMEFTELRNDERVDSRMYPELQRMFDDCRAAGLLPLVYSGYRTQEMQQELYDNKIAAYLAEGCTQEEAERNASQWVAEPGTSEHQLGLAVDIDSEDISRCSDEAVWDWLKEHCAEYGFILRYPADAVEITGIQHEPWHFRYVGQEAAKEIMERGITLEEYLGEVNS